MDELDTSDIPKLDIEDSLARSINDDFSSRVGEDEGFLTSFREEIAYYTPVTPFSPSSIKKGGKWTYVSPK